MICTPCQVLLGCHINLYCPAFKFRFHAEGMEFSPRQPLNRACLTINVYKLRTKGDEIMQ
jgi:hypothetical protein